MKLTAKSSRKRGGYNFRRLMVRPIDRLSGTSAPISRVDRFHSARKMQ
jgi:hypothetical protein